MKKLLPIIIFVLLTLGALFVYADGDSTAISSVTVLREKSGYKLEIKAELSAVDNAIIAGGDVYLFELAPSDSSSQINSMYPVASAAPARNVSFTLECTAESKRVYSKFVLARKSDDGNYLILAPARYIDNPELFAVNDYAFPTPVSKKGLAVQLYTDAQLLGAAHTIINVPVNEYIQTVKSSSSLTYSAYGENFYLNRDKLDYLDYRIKLLTDAGCNVYLNFILSAPEASMSNEIGELYYNTECDTKASLYAYNVKSETAVKNLEAFVHYLALRYTDAKCENGFAGSFIVGYNVNSNRSYNFMGAMSTDSYLNYYTVAYRIIDSALRTAYSNGKSYISLNGNFNTINFDTYATITDENLDYTSKEILDLFAEKIAYSGDIPWGVMLNCYPSDKNRTDFTTDEFAKNSNDAPYISINNIGVFTDYMKNPEKLYKGNMRNIAVSFGISSCEEGEIGKYSPDDASALEKQAAMYAYAYYKIAFNKYIEAGIYYRSVDSKNEIGNFGLWTSSSEGNIVPAEMKPIYNVFRYIDTPSSLETTDFAKKILNISDWGELINNFDANVLPRRRVIAEAGKIETKLYDLDSDPLFDFTKNSMCGFTPSDNCDYIEVGDLSKVIAEAEGSCLDAKGHYIAPAEYAGVGIVFDEKMSIKKAEGFYVTLQCRSAQEGSVDYADVMLRITSKDDEGFLTVYEGVVSSVECGRTVTLYYDISPLTSVTGKIDGIKIWVRPTDTKAHAACDFTLVSIDIDGGAVRLLTILSWFFMILVALTVIGVIVLLILRSVNEKKRKRLRREKAAAQNAANHTGKVFLPRNSMNNTQSFDIAQFTAEIDRIDGRNVNGNDENKR